MPSWIDRKFAILGYNSKNSALKIAKNGKIFVVSIFVDILVSNFAQW